MDPKDIPYQKAPCSNCPFRKDSLKGWLGKERMTDICSTDSFACHKRNDLQCAGHMALLGQASAFVRIMNALGFTPEIRNTHQVFDDIQDCIDHHS